MIQKSYSKFFVESPSFMLQTSENTSPNASQTAIDHHPLTLCLRISENSTTTTISIEGPDPVDAKIFEDPCVHPTLIGNSHVSIPFRRRSRHEEKSWILKHSFRHEVSSIFQEAGFPWNKSNFPWWILPAACLAGGRIPAVAATRHSWAFTSMTQVSDNMWPLVRSLPHQWIQRMRLDAHYMYNIYIYVNTWSYIYIYIISIYSLAFSSSTFKVTISLQNFSFILYICSSLPKGLVCRKKMGKHHHSTPPKMTRPMDVPKATWWSLGFHHLKTENWTRSLLILRFLPINPPTSSTQKKKRKEKWPRM